MTTQTTNSATQQTASGVDSTDNGLDSRIDGVPTELIVGGQRRPASDRGTFPVLDPATGKTLADVANGTEADALACVDAAEAAAADWAATPPRQRGEILRAAFQLMVDRADQLAALIVAENGKARPDARGEVLYSAEFFRWYSEEAVRIDGAGAHGTRRHQPDPRHPPARRHLRSGHPMELPGGHGLPKDRAGARGRVHRDPQAGQRDAPYGAGSRGDSRGGRRAAPVWSMCSRHAGRARSCRRCSPTPACGNCRSPDPPRWAGRYSRKPPNTLSTARWNSGETRRLSSSRTLISTPRLPAP